MKPMKARRLLKILKAKGCEIDKRSGKGGHQKVVHSSGCMTVIPSHGSEDLTVGLLKSIEKQMAKCLGEKWLEQSQ